MYPNLKLFSIQDLPKVSELESDGTKNIQVNVQSRIIEIVQSWDPQVLILHLVFWHMNTVKEYAPHILKLYFLCVAKIFNISF